MLCTKLVQSRFCRFPVSSRNSSFLIMHPVSAISDSILAQTTTYIGMFFRCRELLFTLANIFIILAVATVVLGNICSIDDRLVGQQRIRGSLANSASSSSSSMKYCVADLPCSQIMHAHVVKKIQFSSANDLSPFIGSWWSSGYGVSSTSISDKDQLCIDGFDVSRPGRCLPSTWTTSGSSKAAYDMHDRVPPHGYWPRNLLPRSFALWMRPRTKSCDVHKTRWQSVQNRLLRIDTSQRSTSQIARQELPLRQRSARWCKTDSLPTAAPAFVIALNKVLLPTFGKPTIPNFIILFSSLLFYHQNRKLYAVRSIFLPRFLRIKYPARHTTKITKLITCACLNGPTIKLSVRRASTKNRSTEYSIP